MSRADLPDTETTDARETIGFREFVGLMAAVMALVALAIDSMLPALPAIGRALGVAQENQRQYVLTAFMMGFGLAQLVIGILSDWLGRKRLMLGSLLCFGLFSFIAAGAADFEVLLIARFCQGAAAAGGRVLVTSIVRDLYAGRRMARVMSLAQILFLAAPVVAPSVGQAILWLATWRWIFIFIGAVALTVLAWVTVRLPETLPPEKRLPLNARQLKNNLGIVLTERQSLGYTLAATLMVGGLMGFLNSVQPIFEHVFKQPDKLAVIFGLMAIGMGIGSYFNSRIVERVGMRKISHAAIIGFIAMSGLHVTLALLSPETLMRFFILQTLMMMCFVLAGGNFSAMAMEHMGRVAGTASSVQGFFTTVGAALIGVMIGQAFNNTVIPLYAGCCFFSLLSLMVVLITERGKLFVPHTQLV
jgi:MFS transporter, DHA1 family, multidrug resistance protein